MAYTGKEMETTAETRRWEWEVIEDPVERLRLIGATIQERVTQKLAAALGEAELAISDNPKFAENAKEHAKLAHETTLLVKAQLMGIQRVIKLDPKQPLPIDRKTYANNNKAIIVLEQVPDPDENTRFSANSPG